MESFENSPVFELQPTIEQQPFQNKSVQQLFAKWCEANDSIKPEIIDRQTWEKKQTDGFLQKYPDGSSVLFVPKDLQLWEMLDIIKAVDQDTFASKPERAEVALQRLHDLGKTFEDTGVYLNQRLSAIEEGRDIAESLAHDFYFYGKSILDREQVSNRDTNLKSVSLAKNEAEENLMFGRSLTEEETAAVDAFLAGDSLLVSRQSRIPADAGEGERARISEEVRQRALAQYFRVAHKALELEQKSQQGELQPSLDQVEPWQRKVTAHRQFIEHAQQSIANQIEKPKQELYSSIFRRGMELLQQTMPIDSMPDYVKEYLLNLHNEERTLREALHIDELKAQLDEVKQTGDITKISATERYIASTIQIAISQYQPASGGAFPSQIRITELLNCVGYATLGFSLMSEVGLTLLSAHVPGHQALLLITQDGSVEWRELQHISERHEITDNMVQKNGQAGPNPTISDIVAFSKYPTQDGIRITLNKTAASLYEWPNPNNRAIDVLEASQGLEVATLDWTGQILADLNKHKEAVYAHRQVIAKAPRRASGYNNLAGELRLAHKYDESIAMLQKAILLDPHDPKLYANLGNLLLKIGDILGSIKASERAIAENYQDASIYLQLGKSLEAVGRHQDAIDAYSSFVHTPPDPSEDQNVHRILVEGVQSRIAMLEKNYGKFALKTVKFSLASIKEISKRFISRFVTISVE